MHFNFIISYGDVIHEEMIYIYMSDLGKKEKIKLG